MKRIWIMSDIHDDASRQHVGNFSLPRDVDADVIVIAGDIAGRLSKMGRSWLEAQDRGIPIVIVAGNHDFWRGDLDNEIERFREKCSVDWVHVLEGEAIELAGIRFVGGSLWTDYKLWNGSVEEGAAAAKSAMNDFRYMRTDRYGRRVHPGHLAAIHARHRRVIDETLSIPFAGPSVVVTHHAPSAKSLRAGRVREASDAAYASDLEDLILRRQPDLWIHGHVHASHDYTIGETRIMCNPRGYVGPRPDLRGAPGRIEHDNYAFNPRLVVEVSRKPKIDPYGMPQSYEDELEMWRLSQPIADEDETPPAERKPR